MNNRKTKILTILSLCFVLLFLTIAYAAISSRLSINGTAQISGEKWNVVFLEKDKTIDSKGKAVCNIGIIDKTSITGLSAQFKLPGDSCIFTIPIQNIGTLSASLTDVIGKSTNLTFEGKGLTKENDEKILKDYITYEVDYGQTLINSGTLFDDIDTLEANEKETVTLRVTFTSDAQEVPKEEVTIKGLDREFIFENKKDLTEGGTPTTGQNGKVLETPITEPNAPVLNGDMIPVYYDEGVGEWRKASINNLNNNWYDYSKQQWANAVTVYEQTVEDLSEHGNNGIIHGTTVSNGEAYFDGKDDYVDCGYGGYNFKNQMTMILRFKANNLPSNSSEVDIFGNWEAAGYGFTYNYKNSKKLDLLIYSLENKAYEILSVPIEINNYYTIVGTYDGKTIKLYVNGSLQASKEVTMNIKSSSYPFIIGGNLNSDNRIVAYSNITVTDALLFDKALTEEEILKYYSNEISIGQTKPLFFYDFLNINKRENYKNSPNNTVIQMGDINTMWVWIPRYSYTIKKEMLSTDYYGKATYRDKDNLNPTRELPGEIDVKFIGKDVNDNGNAKYTGTNPSGWRTNDAFNFGGEARSGIWVGKFETTGSLYASCINEGCNVSSVSIKPGITSIRKQIVSSLFYIYRSMQLNNANTYGFTSSGDLHMMKNDEWGAVVYLSQSRYGKYGNTNYSGKNKEIYQNKSSGYITGSSNGTTSEGAVLGTQYVYNDMKDLGTGKGSAGPGASTTGTIYGVYDMVGGGYEYVMGVLAYSDDDTIPMSGNTNQYNSGFSGKLADGSEYEGINFFGGENSKYYNMYKSASPTDSNYLTVKADQACNGGVCYGHAFSETFGTTSGTLGWYENLSLFPYHTCPWLIRGGHYSHTGAAGVFSAERDYGNTNSHVSSRAVFTP